MQAQSQDNLIAVAADDAPAAAPPAGSEPVGLVRPAAPAPLRLPLFSRLIEPWPARIAERLAGALRLRPEIGREPMRIERFGAYADALAGNALTARIETGEGRDIGLLTFERAAVLHMLDAVLGGAGKPLPEAAFSRSFTLIERSLMQPALMHVLEALSECVRPAGTLALAFAGWADQRKDLPPAREGDAVLILPLTLTLRGVRARAELVLPVVALEPMRTRLAAAYPGEALGTDRTWRTHLAAEIGRSRVGLVAVLCEKDEMLGRMRALAVGETLVFDTPVDPVVRITSGGVTLATGRLGRSNGRIAIRLDAAPDARTEDQP